MRLKLDDLVADLLAFHSDYYLKVYKYRIILYVLDNFISCIIRNIALKDIKNVCLR
jgi:hypothetical protein